MMRQKKKKATRHRPGFVSVVKVRNIHSHLSTRRVTDKVSTQKRLAGRPANILNHSNTDTKDFRDLVRYFMRPLMSHVIVAEEIDGGEGMSVSGFYEERIKVILGASYRDIILAAASSAFIMPGRLWGSFDNPGNPDETTSQKVLRKIHEGTPLIVRIDERTPDRIDIERILPGGSETDPENPASVVFSLTNAEYAVVYEKIVEIGGLNNRLVPPGTIDR